jgi:hypothetical protein
MKTEKKAGRGRHLFIHLTDMFPKGSYQPFPRMRGAPALVYSKPRHTACLLLPGFGIVNYEDFRDQLQYFFRGFQRLDRQAAKRQSKATR